VAGVSPGNIAKRLNAEGIPGPNHQTWGPSTIHGHQRRGTGLLNNELYIGRLVWNRQRYVRDPSSGRRVSRLNPVSEWIVIDVPQLRILSNEAWQATKQRQQQMRALVAHDGQLRGANRPKHLFSGLIRCGLCGSSYVMAGAHRLACTGRLQRGICTNGLTIRREDVETRVLAALQTRLFESEPFQVFCEEFRIAVNEARMQAKAVAVAASRERERIDRELSRLIQSIKDFGPSASISSEIRDLEGRKNDLMTNQAVQARVPPLLHPAMADVWRRQVTQLRDALLEDRADAEARDAVRRMVDEIRLTPRDGALAIEVKGNLAGIVAFRDLCGRLRTCRCSGAVFFGTHLTPPGRRWSSV
jgi:hypothetical protein